MAKARARYGAMVALPAGGKPRTTPAALARTVN
jgi:hypothetical protein